VKLRAHTPYDGVEHLNNEQDEGGGLISLSFNAVFRVCAVYRNRRRCIESIGKEKTTFRSKFDFNKEALHQLVVFGG
jgi:hypothetical protein